MVHLTRLGIVTLVLLSVGCAAGGEEEDLAEADSALAAIPTRTVCFGGATWGEPTDIGGISPFMALCRDMPGLIRDQPGGSDAKYTFFQWTTSLQHVVDVIVEALDTNNDGNVTNTDAPANLALIGYSWGGFNARDVAELIAQDRRFSPLRKPVHRLVALDAYKWSWGEYTQINVPANVQNFTSFRHTIAPADDCSRIVPWLVGPFTGRNPYCTGSTKCRDFDYSRREATKGIDHCEVVQAATDNVKQLMAGQPMTNLPTELQIRRY